MYVTHTKYIREQHVVHVAPTPDQLSSNGHPLVATHPTPCGLPATFPGTHSLCTLSYQLNGLLCIQDTTSKAKKAQALHEQARQKTHGRGKHPTNARPTRHRSTTTASKSAPHSRRRILQHSTTINDHTNPDGGVGAGTGCSPRQADQSTSTKTVVVLACIMHTM